MAGRWSSGSPESTRLTWAMSALLLRHVPMVAKARQDGGRMILVTGAGGHLGANLLRRLLADGESVRALLHTARDEPAVAGLSVERMAGDLRDPAVAEAAVAGCRQIYHCAAKVSTTYGDRDEIFACNVMATRNVLRAAAAAGIEKVVVTGSFSAVGHRRDGPSDESVPFNPLDRHLPYGHTKAAVEHECLKACADGLPVVVAVSTAILGPWDFKPSRMGEVLIRFAEGRLRAYVPGGFTFVAARDIVEGHVLAMAQGRPGQKYIFGSEFLSFDEIMALFARVTGRPADAAADSAGADGGRRRDRLRHDALCRTKSRAAADAGRDPHPPAQPPRRYLEGGGRAWLPPDPDRRGGAGGL